jgi:hypothetical protein
MVGSTLAANGIVQSCSSPDTTPYVTFALVIIVGAAQTIVGHRRVSRPSN